MDNTAKIQEARKRAAKKAALYKRLFTTPDGKKVLTDLREMFDLPRTFVPNDPYATHVRVGEKDVLQYITEFMEADYNG